MGEAQRDSAFWTLWATIAAVLVAAGLGLEHFGHPVAGKSVFYAGILVVSLCVIAILVPTLRKALSVASDSILDGLRTVVNVFVEAYKWAGALLLGPLIASTLRQQGLSQTQGLSWTAEKKRGPQKGDFLPLARTGYRVVGGRFIARPEYAAQHWHAGFRLTPTSDDLESANLGSTVLCSVTNAYGEYQMVARWDRDGGEVGHTGVHPQPSYQFDFSVQKSADIGRFRLIFSVNGDTPLTFDFASNYAERLVLVAWGDGQDYRVHFEQISVSWTRMES